MPTTTNGVGTDYIGKHNISTRDGVCEHCHYEGTLTSYDTRLWFVLVYVPIIPLGRKRILDYCKFCTRHYAVNAEQYAKARQEAFDEAARDFTSNPNGQTALEYHGGMLAFGDLAAAANFRQSQQARFAADVEYFLGLGEQLIAMQQTHEGLQMFAAAFRADPSNGEARIGAGELAMYEGRLQDARQLLAFLEQPGAAEHFSLDPLLELARLFQELDDHATTLQLTASVLRVDPERGQQYLVRKLVRQSEEQIDVFESQLPPLNASPLARLFRIGPGYPNWQRWTVATVLVLLMLLAGMLLWSANQRRHCQLHVTNGLGQPVQVQIDDEPPVTVNGLAVLAISAGKHRIQVSGAVQETHDVEINSGWWESWGSQPLWVLNPAGAAVLIETRLVYAGKPRLPQERMIVATPFLYFPRVDYPFTDAPFQMLAAETTGHVVKIQLDWKPDNGLRTFEELLRSHRKLAREFAEASLTRNPHQPELSAAYQNARQKPAFFLP